MPAINILSKKNDLLNLVEKYIETGENKDLAKVSEKMVTEPVPYDKIREKFYDLLQFMSFTKLKQAFKLMEYLTFVCPEQLIGIINDSKFLEQLSIAVFDQELSKPLLNLLKVWNDAFSKRESELPELFNLIANLPSFDAFLPDHYVSEYQDKALAFDTDSDSDDYTDSSHHDAHHFERTKLFADMRKAIQNGEKLLADPEFDTMDREYRKSMITIIQDRFEELKGKYIMNLATSLPSKHEKEDPFDKMIKVSELIEKKSLSIPTFNINLTEVPSNNYEKFEVPEIDELFAFKTEPCHQGQVCSNAPINSKKDSTYLDSSDLLCIKWHNHNDRRRLLYDEKGLKLYRAALCPQKKSCNKGDRCHYSHNLYESHFHPSIYKTIKCFLGFGCPRSKYCPYFHTEEEKAYWKEAFTVLNTDTDKTSDEKKENSNYKISVIDTSSSAYESKEYVVKGGRRKRNDSHDDDLDEQEEVGALYSESKKKRASSPAGTGNQKILNYEKPIQITNSLQNFNKKLIGKLKVNSVYRDPGVLTNLLVSNLIEYPIFSIYLSDLD